MKKRSKSAFSSPFPSLLEGTKNALLVAAKKLFAKKGYEGTSIKDLVEEAGAANVGSVSYHFGGKEGLYRACVENYGKSKVEMARRVLRPPQTLEELKVRLTLFVEEAMEDYCADPDFNTILHRDIEMENTLIEDIFRSTFLRVFEMLTDFLEVAKKNKMIRQDLDIHKMGYLFFGLITHLTRTDGLCKKYYGNSLVNPEYRSSMVTHIITLFLQGILREEEIKAKKK